MGQVALTIVYSDTMHFDITGRPHGPNVRFRIRREWELGSKRLSFLYSLYDLILLH
jgi:hypothetical protein